MYEEFYGLSHRPFLTVPDPETLYWADAHSMAYTMLRYGIMSRAPITVVTGEIGAGKTTLLRALLREIPDDLVVGLVSNMQAGRGELLHWVMMALGAEIQDGESYVRLFQRFQDFVIDAYGSGRRVVLIFDEAQNMGVETLEELRMLSNINADKDELLQLMLVGQPELRELLMRPELAQFAQRVTADYHLTTLTASEVEDYIQHRMARAGARWRVFPAETCQVIAEATRGVPRLVNTLSDMALTYGYSAEAKVIDETLIREFLTSAQERGIYGQFSYPNPQPALVRQVR
jgi:type II secretory pathway predicted ATPase ExeA